MPGMIINGIYIFSDGSDVTLSSGVLTIDDYGYFQIAAQTGVADDLDTINYSVTGVIPLSAVFLRADVGDTITVKHGTGNIYLNGDADFVLSGNKTLMLAFDGTNWTDVGISGGSSNVSLFSFAPSTELTISGGAITATSSNHTIDTEGDAPTDDLDTISGGTARQLLLIRAENTARTIIVKHGTGNIYTINGTDITLDTTEKALLLYNDGTKWLVIGDGGAGGGGGGTVTSVGLSAPAIFSVSGSPVTTSGTLTLALVTQNANTVWAGPTSAPAANPAFRALVAADIPSLDTSKITTGTLIHEHGGLEADVSGYDGIVRISGGATSALSLPLAHEHGGLEADVSAYTGAPRINAGATFDLGTGTVDEFLRGDYTWQVPPVGDGTDFICIVDEKSAGTSGGTFTSGAWRTRDLNTERADPGGYASVGSNQITLAAGTYRAWFSAPAFSVNRHKTRLQDITNTVTLIVGSSEYAASLPSLSVGMGRFTLSGTTTIELQHYCQITRSTDGFGIESNFAVVEVYAQIIFWRE